MDLMTIVSGVGGISIVALIKGLVKVARDIGMPSKYAPLMSVGLGIVLGIPATMITGLAFYYGIIGGIAVGLMASGSYDIGKSVTDSTKAPT